MSNKIKMRAVTSVPPLRGRGDTILRAGAKRGAEFDAHDAEDARMLVQSGRAVRADADAKAGAAKGDK